MDDQSSTLVKIHTLTNRFEADILMDALQQEDIPAILKCFEETPYTGLFVTQRGWGQILVPSEFEYRARQIIWPVLHGVQTGRLCLDSSELDPLLWDRLREADPRKICRQALVGYEEEKNAFVVPFLTGRFLCLPDEERIEPIHAVPSHKPDFQFHLAMLHYLLEASEVEPSGNWIGEKEIPSGESFFRGPHAFPVQMLADEFGSRPALFSAACLSLGGREVDMGDMAYRLMPFPRIPILLVLWEGDDEFESVLHVRFDETIVHQLHNLDTIWALVNTVCSSLDSAAGQITGEEKQ
ncbi:MAG: DUF3786 domain-containing protein [Syntrophobacteraceae bacterium]